MWDNLAVPLSAPDALIQSASQTAWDAGVRVLQGCRLGADDRDHVAELLRAMAPPYGSVIADLGCGYGEVARLMQDMRPDLGFWLLNCNMDQLRRAPLGAAFRHLLADMHDIPLPDGSVDGVMLHYTFCHSAPHGALLEARRITRTGGFCSIYDYERLSGDNREMARVLYARAFTFDETVAFCEHARWRLVSYHSPDGDDTLFRSLFTDRAAYEAIFRDLRPIIWKLEAV